MSFKDLKKRAWLFCALFLIIAFSFFILFTQSKEKEMEFNEIIIDTEKEAIVENEAEQFQALLNPVAVSIDNYPNNPYLKGLQEAIVVYELPSEGGSSRFLAIYDNSSEDEFVVGPVRSLRKYFLDYLNDFGALAIHCGGSPDALATISSTRLKTLNEFYNNKYFKRDDRLKAPNNIYLKNSDWLRYLIDQDKERQEENWLFAKESNLVFDNYTTSGVISSYYSPAYQANWTYDSTLEIYLRDPYEITAKTLIFHFVKVSVMDELLRLKFSGEREGEAIICYLGRCYKGNWKKEDLHRYYIDEQEVLFEKDKVWINIMPQFAQLSF